jgi:hypothetical protein
MKTKAALALSLTGILLTGSTAIATSAQSLSNSTTGTNNDAKNVLVKDDSATRTAAPTPAKVVPKAASKVATKASDDTKASTAKKASRPAEPGDDKGGQRTAPETGDDHGGSATPQAATGIGTVVVAEPGDDKGGLTMAAEPGDDSGGHGGHGSDD